MYPVISVIVPVYNAEKYLKRCVDSIRNQSYKNLEIILVNDGSNDASGSICDEYSKLDSRIISLHKLNGGASDSRNKALDLVKGDYIGFVDSDDWVDLLMYEIMLSSILKNKADIAVCGFNVVNSDGSIDRSCAFVENEIVYDNKSSMDKLFDLDERFSLDVAPWNKLIKTKILCDLRFEVGRTCEDTIIAPLIFQKCHKAVHVSGLLYNYYMSPNSVSRMTFTKKNLDYIYATEKHLDWIKYQYPTSYSDAFYRYMRSIYIVLKYYFTCTDNIYTNTFEYIKSHYLKVKKVVKGNDVLITKKHKKLFNRLSLMIYTPKLYKFIKRY